MEIELLDGMIEDYGIYHMSKNEFIGYFAIAALAIAGVAYLFYGYWWVGILGLPLAAFYPKMREKAIIKARSERLRDQFKEMLYALSSNMQAGKSIESAFCEIYGDMQIMYPNPKMEIMVELEHIIRHINVGVPLEAILEDFAQRTQEEDIQTFVDVYSTTKSMGGNLIEVIRNTSDTISEKIEVKQQINLSIASTKFEQKVLMFVPIGVILMLKMMSPEYMDQLYGNIFGIVCSTLALVLCIIGHIVGNKITDIQV